MKQKVYCSNCKHIDILLSCNNDKAWITEEKENAIEKWLFVNKACCWINAKNKCKWFEHKLWN